MKIPEPTTNDREWLQAALNVTEEFGESTDVIFRALIRIIMEKRVWFSGPIKISGWYFVKVKDNDNFWVEKMDIDETSYGPSFLLQGPLIPGDYYELSDV